MFINSSLTQPPLPHPVMSRYLTIIRSLLLVLILVSCGPEPETTSDQDMQATTNFDWQGHRGARGLAPENSLPAFLLALEYPQVTTLELDVVISRDSQVVVSHEPWMSEAICTDPEGKPLAAESEAFHNIFELPYAQIRAYDCGSIGNDRFPEQQRQPAYKPLLREVIEAAETRARDLERALPYYNIEIKSRPEWDNQYTPAPPKFAELVVAVIREAEITDRAIIQSFDERSLRAAHEIAPELKLAYLVETPGDFDRQIENLGFIPAIYSPHHLMVSAQLVDTVHQRGLHLIPWTVNDTSTMSTLIEMGVDGIITDYPNLIQGL